MAFFSVGHVYTWDIYPLHCTFVVGIGCVVSSYEAILTLTFPHTKKDQVLNVMQDIDG